jgi:hypothetical protein
VSLRFSRSSFHSPNSSFHSPNMICALYVKVRRLRRFVNPSRLSVPKRDSSRIPTSLRLKHGVTEHSKWAESTAADNAYRLNAISSAGRLAPPVATTRNCFPFSMYVMGAAVALRGSETSPADLPVALSNAIRLGVTI